MKQFIRKVRQAVVLTQFAVEKAAFLRADSRKIIEETNDRDRTLFVDCGSNLGQGFSAFSKWFGFSNIDYVMIEPNPHCAKVLREDFLPKYSGKPITLIEKAAGTQQRTVKFFGLVEDNSGALNEGGSIFDAHNSAYYEPDKERAIEVEEFSFADFLREKRPHYKNIVVKMDIEGAEYDVLEDLRRQNLLDVMNISYIEFHSEYMQEPDRSKFKKIEAELSSAVRESGCTLRIWH